jgi:hypothetical protein
MGRKADIRRDRNFAVLHSASEHISFNMRIEIIAGCPNEPTVRAHLRMRRTAAFAAFRLDPHTCALLRTFANIHAPLRARVRARRGVNFGNFWLGTAL